MKGSNNYEFTFFYFSGIHDKFNGIIFVFLPGMFFFTFKIFFHDKIYLPYIFLYHTLRM